MTESNIGLIKDMKGQLLISNLLSTGNGTQQSINLNSKP